MSTQTQLTGACGEHYVAAILSGKGYVVALPRGGSPVVDLLVSSSDGKHAITVQVKTATSAWKGTKGKEHWEWPISSSAEENFSDKLFYAFVDLRGWPNSPQSKKKSPELYEEHPTGPLVFVASSETIRKAAAYARNENWKRFFWWLPADKGKDYLEKWSLIEGALSGQCSGTDR